MPPVSVIICAKNEAANLRKNLPFFLEQDYPGYELIVVNDGSEDDTLKVLQSFQGQQLKIINLPLSKENTGKKRALKAGLKAAAHDRVLLSDADCRPASNQWISRMMSSRNGDFVLGYSPFGKSGSFLNKFIRFETTLTALQYLNLALWKLPVMGVGRNLSYSIAAAPPAVAFTQHEHLLSGDDDLAVNRFATGRNTQIQIAPEAWCWTTAETVIRQWFAQKYRHFSTGIYYKPVHQLLLGIFNGSHFLFYLLLIILLLFSGKFILLSILYLVRMGIFFIIGEKLFTKLGQRDLIYTLPIWDFLYSIFLVVFAPAVFFNQNQKWK